MKLTKIISGFVALCCTVSAVPLFELPSFAEGNSAVEATVDVPFTEWNGYDMSTVDFDEWDGTYTYDWLDESEGTAADPYIIDTAEDLMSLSQLSAVETILTDRVTDNNFTRLSNIDLASSGTYKAYKKADTRFMPTAYSYTLIPTVSLESIEIETENSPKTIMTTGQVFDWYYITKAIANVNVSGVVYSTDITSWAQEIALHNEGDSVNDFWGCLEKTEFINLSEYTAYTGESGNRLITQFPFSLSVTARLNQGVVYLVAGQRSTNSYGWGGPMTYKLTYPVGTFDDLGLELPDLIATNTEDATDVITISETDYDAYWLPDGKTWYTSSSLPKLTNVTEETELKNDLRTSFGYVDYSGTYNAYPYMPNMNATECKTKMVLNVSPGSGYVFMLFQDKQATESYLYDESFYVAKHTYDANNPLGAIYSVSFKPTSSTLYAYLTEVLPDGSTYKYTYNWSWDISSYPYLYRIKFIHSFDENGTLWLEPEVQIQKSNKYVSSSSQKTTLKLQKQGQQVKGKSVLTIDDLMNMSTISDCVDQDGNSFIYTDIKDTVNAVGYSFVSTQSTQSTALTYWKSKSSTNRLIKNIDSAATTNTYTNPTFKGKYIKVVRDMKIEGVANSLFPITFEETNVGLAGTLDFDNHVLYWDAEPETTPIGTVQETGRLQNVVWVSNYDNPVICSATEYIRRCLVDKNKGVVSGIICMPIDAFEGILDTRYKTPTLGVCSVNSGLLSDIILIHSGACCVNAGVISDAFVFMRDYTSLMDGDAYSYFIGAHTTGLVNGLTIIAEGNKSNVFMSIVRGGVGTFENINYSNYTYTGTSANYPFYEFVGTIKDSQFEWYFPNSYSGYMFWYNGVCSDAVVLDNVDLFIESPRMSLIYMYGSPYGCIIKDSNIHMEMNTADDYLGGVSASYATDSTITVNCSGGTRPTYLTAKDCTINLSDTYQETIGEFYDCIVNIGTARAYGLSNRVQDTVFNIDKMHMQSGDNSDLHFQPSSYLGDWGGQPYWENVDYIVKEATGVTPCFSSLNAKNCRWSIHMVGEIKSITGNVTRYCRRNFVNNEVYLTFDEQCSGGIGMLAYFDDMTVVDSLFYIGEMPDTVTFGHSDNQYIAGTLFGGDNNIAYKGITVIAPKLNVGAIKNDRINVALFAPNSIDSSISDMYVYANLYVPAELGVTSASVLMNYTNRSNKGVGLRDAYLELNVFDKDTKQPTDIACYALYGNLYLNDTLCNYNTAFRSNTLSGRSGMVAEQANSFYYLTDTTGKKAVFKNCYLDLYNVPLLDLSAIDETTDVAQGGFVNGTLSNQETNWYKAMWMKHDLALSYTNCFVPTNQGITPLKLSATEPDILDVLLNYDSLEEAYQSGAAPTNALTAWYFNNRYAFTTFKPTLEYLQTPVDGVSYTNADAISTGELAYQLDNGSQGSKRSYSWTVMEEDVWLKNSITNERLWEFPASLAIADMYLPTRCVDGEVNLNPVFKTTVLAAEGGELEITGIADKRTTAGDVYIKAGARPVTNVTTNGNDILLVYATQKLGTSRESVIPSTPLRRTFNLRANPTSIYDISGYEQQSIDTVITPVFKTARYITVDIENGLFGTVIPSAYVSAEGEKIKLTMDVDEGYIINNLRVNGTLLSGTEFYMPDEDVTITGECVPFDGGITKFVLFGIPGEIDQMNKTITVNVPKSNYITNALPDIAYVGDYISPGLQARQDFTQPVDYTVTYGDNQTVTYTVTVNQGNYTMRIYDYVINGVHGVIDQANRTITVKLPDDTDLLSLKPDDIAYSAETITPDVNTALNFTVDQFYTLYTTGMSPVTYTVNVETTDPDTALIEEYKVSGVQGDITNNGDDKGTITLSMPKGMDLTAIVPDNVMYIGKTLSPSKVDSVNLNSESTTYTVGSQSGLTRTYNLRVNYVAEDEAHIDTFKVAGYNGVIDETTHTITVEVPFGTNMTGITPDELKYTGKAIYPAIDKEQDFTDDVTYTVVAGDNTEVSYTIVVTHPVRDAKLIEFEVLGFPGVIDEENKTVTIDFPYGVDITDVAPSKVVVSDGATLTPDETSKQDFTKDIVYTVESEDKRVQNEYTIHCNVALPDDTAEIISFAIDEYPGIIEPVPGQPDIIRVTLPPDYPKDELKDKVPTIVWKGKDIEPNDDEEQDFTKPIEYKVYAENPDIINEYVIYVTVAERPQYTITYKANEGGILLGSHTVAYAGDTIDIVAKAKRGYSLQTLLINGQKASKTTFTMPASNVVVEAVFIANSVPDTPKPPVIDDTPIGVVTTTEFEWPVITVPITTTAKSETVTTEKKPITEVSVEETPVITTVTSTTTTTQPPVDIPVDEEIDEDEDDENPQTGLIVFTPVAAVLLLGVSGVVIATRKREDD